MVSTQLAKAKPEYRSKMCLSFLLCNLIFEKISGLLYIWGIFIALKKITIVLILWLSENLSDYNTPQVVWFPNAYVTSIICAGLF